MDLDKALIGRAVEALLKHAAKVRNDRNRNSLLGEYDKPILVQANNLDVPFRSI
jgi:hypothetical protein